MNRLASVELEGFKSIRSATLELRGLNVLIGANGAGKSNLFSFFTMVNFMTTGALQDYIGQQGGAHSVLRNGPKATLQVVARLAFETDTGSSSLTFRLMYAAPDTLIFGEERIVFKRPGYHAPQDQVLGAGHKESLLRQEAERENRTARVVQALLFGCKVFQFHDTSKESRVRQAGYIDDNRYLCRDGGNLAAFLYRLQQTSEQCYRRIVASH